MIATLLICCAFTQHVEAGPPLDHKATKNLIKKTEEQMVDYRLANPPTVKGIAREVLIGDEPIFDPKAMVITEQEQDGIVVCETSPLLGKVCTFKLRHVRISVDKDSCSLEIAGTIAGYVERLLTWQDVFPDAESEDRLECSDMIRAARHEIQARLPEGHTITGDVPKYYDLIAKVNRVAWNKNAALPMLILQADFVSSKVLNLHASGVVEVRGTGLIDEDD